MDVAPVSRASTSRVSSRDMRASGSTASVNHMLKWCVRR